MKKIEEGQQIEVGDLIQMKNYAGVKNWRVHRVTKKFAFVRWNDVSEGKFRRTVHPGFQPLPFTRWLTAKYSVYRHTKDSTTTAI